MMKQIPVPYNIFILEGKICDSPIKIKKMVVTLQNLPISLIELTVDAATPRSSL